MLLASTVPERVGPVVLNDIGPVIELDGLIAIRDRMASATAAALPDFEAAVDGLKRALGDRFTAMSEDDWRRFARRIYRQTAGGELVPDYDPLLFQGFAAFDPEVGAPPFWPIYEALAPRPLLLVRGENSNLLSEATLAEMTRRVATAEVLRVADEGHAPLLEDAASIRRIVDFFDEADTASGYRKG